MRRLFADQLKNGQELSTEIDISDFRGNKPSVLQARSKLRPVSMRSVRAQAVKQPRKLPARTLLVFAATIAVAAWLAMRSQEGSQPVKHVITSAVKAGAAPQPARAEKQSVGDRQHEGPTQLPGGAASSGTNPAPEQEPTLRGAGRGTSPGFVDRPGF